MKENQNPEPEIIFVPELTKDEFAFIKKQTGVTLKAIALSSGIQSSKFC